MTRGGQICSREKTSLCLEGKVSGPNNNGAEEASVLNGLRQMARNKRLSFQRKTSEVRSESKVSLPSALSTSVFFSIPSCDILALGSTFLLSACRGWGWGGAWVRIQLPLLLSSKSCPSSPATLKAKMKRIVIFPHPTEFVLETNRYSKVCSWRYH